MLKNIHSLQRRKFFVFVKNSVLCGAGRVLHIQLAERLDASTSESHLVLTQLCACALLSLHFGVWLGI